MRKGFVYGNKRLKDLLQRPGMKARVEEINRASRDEVDTKEVPDNERNNTSQVENR